MDPKHPLFTSAGNVYKKYAKNAALRTEKRCKPCIFTFCSIYKFNGGEAGLGSAEWNVRLAEQGEGKLAEKGVGVTTGRGATVCHCWHLPELSCNLQYLNTLAGSFIKHGIFVPRL